MELIARRRMCALKRQVSPSRTRLALLVAFGLSASLWSTWIAGQAAYRIYLVSGSPTHPSRTLVWWSVFVPSVLLGLAAGIGVTLLLRASPFKGWILFWGSLLIGAVVLTRVPPWTYLATTFSSFGNWVFWAGSLIWPATNHLRQPGWVALPEDASPERQTRVNQRRKEMTGCFSACGFTI
jgi:hypothetical protein